MTPIYIKLGSADTFRDERLGVYLSDAANKTAAALDYGNLTDEIHSGLIAGTIVQITAAEYYSIVQGPVDPINVNTNYLITLSNYMAPCPVDGVIFFAYYNQQWFKVLWSTIRDCALGGAKVRMEFRVGNASAPAPDYPQPDDTSFVVPGLIGKDFKNLLITLNGVKIYHKSHYTETGDEAEFNWFDLNVVTGELTFNAAFSDKDLVSIQEL